MAEAARNGTPLNEDQARRLICTNLAELMRQGSCTVRVRRLLNEGRVTFLAEHQNKWQPVASMDYLNGQAEGILEALLAIGNKRNKDTHLAIHRNGNQEEVTIGFHKEAVTHHLGNLYQYVYGQLFWD